MISCTAIQKLERYGQLGQKRRSIENFVQSSLKDPRRGNVYALTHMPTWRACLAALTENKPSAKKEVGLHSGGDDCDNCEQYDSEDWNEKTMTTAKCVIVISDMLLYAISFAMALVAHHLDEQRYEEKKEKKEVSDLLDGRVFGSELKEAAELLGVLQEVLQACGGHIHHRNDGSPAVTDALAHLLATASDTTLIAATVRYSRRNASDYTLEEGELIREICCASTALMVTTATQLRIAQTQQPLNKIYNVRPCPTLINQFISRSKGNALSADSSTVEDKGIKCAGALTLGQDDEEVFDVIVTRCLAEWAAARRCGSLLGSLAQFTLFQKLSLVDAVVAEAPPLFCCVELTRFRHCIVLLLSAAACNRATRAVVYFRGDDLKLMQHNLRDSTDYALHTHVTTSPSEEALLLTVAQLPVRQQQQHCALLLVQWIASISLFFRSFCAEQSWTVFAQEQRRMVMLQETRVRREQREKRRRKATGDGGGNTCKGGGSNNTVSINGGVACGRGDNLSPSENIERDVDSADCNVSLFGGPDDGDDELCSLLSQQSASSLASRSSIISAMSRSSMTSYRTFISVINAARDGGEEGDAKLHFHQSGDGNTNLPLILLEEVVLAMQRFMSATNDKSVEALLDNFGLCALAWRTIGELYAFIQGTIKATAVMTLSLSASTATENRDVFSVFNFANDIRYNKGLGYEVLGLLFANVVLPQLYAARSKSLRLQRCIEQALTRCFSAYEVIAPQVIDQNIPAILSVAARVVKDDVTQQGKNKEMPLTASSSNSSRTTLNSFLISLLTRLGKSNQIPLLLDSIISHVKKQNDAIQDGCASADENCYKDAGNNNNNNNNNNVAITAGLHEIFSHPNVRMVFLQACGMSLDPEELLVRLLLYVSRWASEEDHSEKTDDDPAVTEKSAALKSLATEPSQLLPQEAIFILDIVATVLEGSSPTSVTSSALLERAAELELVFSTFLVNRLYKGFFANKIGEEEEEKESEAGVRVSNKTKVLPLFAGGDVVRPKMQRCLMLYTLNVIYHARELIFSCLQDLGIQNVEAYLRMLEETMWQINTSVGALVGSLTIDDLNATMSHSTQMKRPPYVHRATLLPQLVLQRLSLAYSVSVALNIDVEPATEARHLVSFVLNCMCPASDDMSLDDGGRIRAVLELADRLTEEEWRCIVRFGRPKRVRRSLVWLLRLSFSAPQATLRFSTNSFRPCWITRCLACCAGFLLEALCEVIVGITDDDICDCCQFWKNTVNEESKKEEEEGNRRIGVLVEFLGALSDILRHLGHIPQWPLLLQRAVHWLLLLSRCIENAQAVGNNRNIEKKITKRSRSTGESLLEQRLLQLIMDFLSCESEVSLLLSRALFSLSSGNAFTQRGGRKSGREKREIDVNKAFEEAIGVSSFSLPVSLQNYENGVPEDEENECDVLVTKESATAGTFLVQQLFSREFATLLVRKCGTSGVNSCAGGITCHLYTTALTVCRGEVSVSEYSSTAHDFVMNVVDAMRCSCCNNADFAGFSAFLSAMNNSPIVFIGAAHGKPISGRASHKRYRHECNETKLPGASVKASNCEEENKDDLKIDNGKFGENTQLCEISRRWAEFLGALLLQVLDGIATKTDAPLLRAFSLLFMSFERAHVSATTRPTAAPVRIASKKKNCWQQDCGRAVKSLTSILAAIPLCISNVAVELRRLFAPTDMDSRFYSLSVLVRLLGSENVWVLRALWILFVLYEDLQRGVLDRVDKSVGEIFSGCWLAAVISMFDPRKDYTACNDDAMKSLLQAAMKTETRRTPRNFAFAFLHNHDERKKEDVNEDCTQEHQEEVITKWLIGQLRVMPSVLRMFPTEAAPTFLQQYMHALLHEAVTFSSLLSLDNIFALHGRSWGRYERLLTAVCGSLRELSLVPHMRFSTWRADVKRLLVAGGASGLLSTGAKELWCSLLELCSLPLPALHDNESFVDHELNFVQVLLSGTSGAACVDEKVFLCILRLFTRTLLPLGVLWRRSALLPGLLSALVTRCFHGVLLGHCGRVVLNQLSSFFFQLVKDAINGGNSGKNKTSGNTSGSSSLKMLCLSSITSCIFRQSVDYIDVFTTHSSDLDFFAADFLKALQKIHLPCRRGPSALRAVVENEEEDSDNNETKQEDDCRLWSDTTLCDLSYACVGNDDGQSLLRQAAERIEEEEGNGERRIFMIPA